MSCEWRIELDGYVDRELAPPQMAECEQHLRTCPHCATAVRGLLQMKQAIRSAAASRYAPSAALGFRLWPGETVPRKARRFWLPQFSLAAAALALLVIAAAAIWVWNPWLPDLADELVDLHVATLASANQVDVLSSDRHTVKPWFEGRLPFAFNLPELQGSPFRLIGGRLTYLRQNPGAHLLVGKGKHQLSVFIFQDRGLGQRFTSFPQESRKLGFTIDTWSQSGLSYAVVGDTAPADIRALRRLFQAAASNPQ